MTGVAGRADHLPVGLDAALAEALVAIGSGDVEAYAVLVVRDGVARIVSGGALEVRIDGTADEGTADEGTAGNGMPWKVGSSAVIAATRDGDAAGVLRAVDVGEVEGGEPLAVSTSSAESYDFLWEATIRDRAPATRVIAAADDTADQQGEPVSAVIPVAPVDETIEDAAPEDQPVSMSVGDATGAPPPQARAGAAPVLVLSTGEKVTLERGVIVGRLPSIRSTASDDPVLLAVPSPQSDISRNHLGVRVEEGTVLVRDLGSTNGTHLRRAGEPVVRIPSDAPTLVRAGDVFDLGEGITVSFENVSTGGASTSGASTIGVSANAVPMPIGGRS